MSERKTIDIVLRGDYRGEKISPYVIDIADLRELLEDVERLVSTENRKKREKISLRLMEGSLAMRVDASAHQINELVADLDHLSKTHSLVGLNPKRAKVIDKWYSRSLEGMISYNFNLIGEDWGFDLSKETPIQPKDDIWVESELYLFGEVTSAGGKIDPNIHLDTKEYGTVLISTTKDKLRDDDKNRNYKQYLIQVTCEQNLDSGEIRNAKFIDWVDYYPQYNENDLKQTTKAGEENWKNVYDSVDYIRKLRGYDD